jgi:hypothetical protein
LRSVCWYCLRNYRHHAVQHRWSKLEIDVLTAVPGRVFLWRFKHFCLMQAVPGQHHPWSWCQQQSCTYGVELFEFVFLSGLTWSEWITQTSVWPIEPPTRLNSWSILFWVGIPECNGPTLNLVSTALGLWYTFNTCRSRGERLRSTYELSNPGAMTFNLFLRNLDTA